MRPIHRQAARSAASVTLASSIALVIGPTPPGTGASHPATSATPGSASPTSPASVLVMPTAMTAAPGLTMSAVSTAGRDDDDVGAAGVRGQVLGAGVAERHGGVLGAPGQQQPEGAADGDPAADDGDVRPGDRHVVAAHQLYDPARRAGQRSPLAEYQPAQVERVQAVGVLARIDPVQDPLRVDVVRQRQLDEIAGAGGIAVQLVDRSLHLLLAGVGRQGPTDAGEPDLGTVAVLAVHVDPAARVVADQDGAETRNDAAGRERGHPPGDIGPDVGGDGLAVQDASCHGGLILPDARRCSGRAPAAAAAATRP